MYEDTYPNFMRTYRELRAEGIDFPPRDPNQRLMMEDLNGIESPMSDFVEQLAGVERPKDKKEIQEEKIQKKEEDQVKFMQPEENAEGFEQDQTDYSKYLDANYDFSSEFEMTKQSLNILDDIQKAATHSSDLKSELARDIFLTSK